MPFTQVRTLDRQQAGWCVYEWANAAFATPVVAVFLGPTLTEVARAAADADGFVWPLGVRVAAGSFFPYAVALAVMLQVLTLPALGFLADRTRRRKELLALFSFVGAGATMGLYALDGERYLLGGVLFIIANLSYGAGVVIFNAFLPMISPPERSHTISSIGWALGYLGGGVLLLIELIFIQFAGALGLTTLDAVRISLAAAGVWWAVFTLVPLRTLKNPAPTDPLRTDNPLAVISELRRYPQTLLFLVAYLIYADGIHTVATLASQFGQEELRLPISTLSMVILLVQFVAFAGSLGWARIARVVGAQRAVGYTLLIWTAALIYAYIRVKSLAEFVALAIVVGLVLGGSQALSRSIFSLMIPRGRETSYFGLYELSDRGTSWLGPLVYGIAVQFTGSYRLAMLSLILFFLVGLLLLSRVDLRRGIRDTHGERTEPSAAVLATGGVQ